MLIGPMDQGSGREMN